MCICMAVNVQTNVYLFTRLFHLEAKHYWNMMNSIPILLWIIWGRWCFPSTWCMGSQDSVLWALSAEELVNEPCERPCDRSVAHQVEVQEQGLLSLEWGRLQAEITAALSSCTVSGEGRARLLWYPESWDKGQQAQHWKFWLEIKVFNFFFFIMAKSCIDYWKSLEDPHSWR